MILPLSTIIKKDEFSYKNIHLPGVKVDTMPDLYCLQEGKFILYD